MQTPRLYRTGNQSSSSVAVEMMLEEGRSSLADSSKNVISYCDNDVFFQCFGGVFAIVGVVPPLLCVKLEGRGDDGCWGRELCFAMMAIFFRRVCKRVRIMETTLRC